MNHQEATKHAQSFFKSYPKSDRFHITVDGQVFAEKHHADAHAKTLKKDEKAELIVHTVERNSDQENVKEQETEKKAAPVKAVATKEKVAAEKPKK